MTWIDDGKEAVHYTRAGLAIFRVHLPLAESFSDILDVVFFPRAIEAAGPVSEDLKQHYQEVQLAPAAVLFLGISPHLGSLRDLARDATIIGSLSRRTTRFGLAPRALVATVDDAGGVVVDDLAEFEASLEVPTTVAINQILLQAMRRIFHPESGFMREDERIHYKSPGGSHQPVFLRTGLAFLQDQAAILAATVAWHRLGGARFTRIMTDTSTVSSVAYAYAYLQQEFASASQPVIGTFGGHAAIAASPDLMLASSSTLYLISASVTLELPRRVAGYVPKGSGSHVVTLFYAGEKKPELDDAILLDASLRGGQNPGGVMKAIVAHPPRDCPLCAKGSVLVEIVGDQLVPATPTIRTRRIVKSDGPEWLETWGPVIFGHGFLRSKFEDTSSIDKVTRATYVDMSSLILGAEKSELSGLIDDALGRAKKFSPDVVVHLGDPASIALNDRFAAMKPKPSPLTYSYAQLLKRTEMDGPAKVLVLASTVSSGRTLVDVSRAIRELAPAAHVRYLVVLARSDSSERWTTVTSDLTARNVDPRHELETLVWIELPNDRAATDSAWVSESILWAEEVTRLRRPRISRTDDEEEAAARLIDCIDARITELGEQGLIDSLFLGQANSGILAAGEDSEARLKLTDGFIFWPSGTRSVSIDRASQADVFATIAAVLHHARTGREGLIRNADGHLATGYISPLALDLHHRTVIAPFTFTRYSDAVIQASILRAALPGELDYSSSSELSRDMRSVLVGLFSRWDYSDGAATGEFLLALATRRLSLRPMDAEAAIASLEDDLPPDHSARAILDALISLARRGIDGLR